MRLGLFGGTFDPVHVGHVAGARAARSELDLDRILFLPTAVPPHKERSERTAALRRFVMVEMALQGEEALLASDFEMGREGPSYAVDTLEHFLGVDPEAELFYLIGMDSLAALPGWRRWQDLPRLARLVVLRRPGYSREQVEGDAPPEIREAIASERILFLENPRWDVSSTDIRERLARGDAPREGDLDPRVLDYARRYHLYDEDASSLSRHLRT